MHFKRRPQRGGSLWPLVGGVTAGSVLGLLALSLALPHLRRGVPAAPPAPQTAPSPSAAPRVNAPVETTRPAPTRDADLQALVEAEAARIPGTAAVHVRVADGRSAGVAETEPMPAASVIKLPLMAAVQHAWRGGRLKRTALDEERVRKMVTVSDNPSADALIDRVGMDPVNSWLEEQGYLGTQLRHKLLGARPNGPNVVTAADMTRMLMEIVEGRLVNAEASAEMRRVLLASERRDRIPAGLPPEAVVGNKTGTLNGIVNDVALVEAPSGVKYTLAALVSGARGERATKRAIARLSSRVYDHLTAGLAPQP